jgi:predicted Zn-dependent protease
MTARQIGAVVCLCAAAGHGKVIPAVVLRVRIVDRAQVPKDKLRHAVNAARDLFHAAGVDTVWSECADCDLPAADTDVEVNILSPAHENGPASKTALGYALRPRDENTGVSVYVFYQRVQQTARAREAFGNELMATVMVHEICHLFGLDHSPEGIMRANLDRGPMGQLSFTPDQVKRLRSAVMARGKTGA